MTHVPGPPIADLIERLRAAGVRVWADGPRLRYAAPQGALTPALLADMGARKAELLTILGTSSTATAPEAPVIPRADRSGPLPVSIAQQRLWFLHHLDRKGATYNVPKAMRLRGPLDQAALEAAFRDVIARHESLRTSFDTRGGEPIQLIHDAVSFTLEADDVSAAPPDGRVVAARTLVAQEAARPFDLSRPSLIRARLIRLGPDDHVLAVVQHHVVSDGRSLEVLFEELAEFYGARRANATALLPPLPIQYADYASHERDWLATPALERKVEWWKTQLDGAPRLLQLPADRPRPAVQTFIGDVVQFAIPAPLTAALRKVAGEARASLFMTTIAALAALLSRYSGQDEICIGSPVENRPFPETARLVGAFINTLVLRVPLEGGPTFTQLLERVRQVALDAFERQDVPFERLVQAVQPERNLTASPLFQVAVSWLNARKGFLALPGVAAEPFDFEFRSVKFDINLEIYESPESLHVAWFYNSALFDRSTMERMGAHFVRLLESAAADASQRVADLEILTAGETRTLVERLNATQAPLPDVASVVALFEAQAARTPDAVAVSFGTRSITYRELDRQAARLAYKLAQKGARPGAIVGILVEPSLDLVASVLAALKTGAAYLPVDPRVPANRLAFMLDEACVVAAITDRNTDGLVPWSVSTITADDWVDAPEHDTAALHPSDAAYVIYTSGSSGKPKGVVIEHRQLLNYVWWALQTYGTGGPVDLPLFTSIAFDLTVTSLYLPLLSGGRVVVYRDEPALPAIFQVVRDQIVDVVKLTPAHLAMVCDLDLSGGRIRRLILGGEDLKTELCRRAVDASKGALEIFNEYGPTEATVGCMIHRFDPAGDRSASVPIGRPAANVRVYVLDRHLHPAPIGAAGELYIAGDGVAREYLRQPALTADRFLADPFHPGSRMYRSGDLARWRADGVMEYLGRTDHQVKIRGHRIELDEIAAELAADERVADCAVVVVERPAAAVEDTAGVRYCARCGLASNYPGTSFTAAGVCNTCEAFERHREKVEPYFRTPEDLVEVIARARARKRGGYDCLALVSGGKDSVYMLARLKDMGARILAYTLDPGYLSEEARANVQRVTAQLGIDHVFGGTPHMNEIFVESLKRHANVCNGCFKTLYTLSMNLAHEQGIPMIVTGLSRGQLFETRLSKYYNAPDFDSSRLDRAVLDARKIYHRLDDVVSRRLDVAIFKDDRIFEQVEVVDFYRYADVSLTDMLAFLEKLGWRRPADTGRSTNCLINDVGIYMHRRKRGYHNYALPYSWDVRMAHKQRGEALEELQDEIDIGRVRRILAEIGWTEGDRQEPAAEQALAAYYVPRGDVTAAELRERLARRLPEPMVPAFFVPLDRLPLTRLGKIDRRALPPPRAAGAESSSEAAIPPATPLEIDIARIWTSVLGFSAASIHDNFFALGGHSLMATRVAARIAEDLGVELPLAILFDKPTIAELSAAIEIHRPATPPSLEDILAEVEGLSDDEARAGLRT